jgi:hypothetical protein
MRLAGRTATLLLMLAPAGLAAYTSSGAAAWLIAAGLLLGGGLGAGLALVATWRGPKCPMTPAAVKRSTN